MCRKLLAVFLTSIFCLSLSAQTGVFDEKVYLGNGRYKVKTNNKWGIVDEDDNLKLSIEYNEPIFMDGKAVVSKFGSQQISGIIDTEGNFMKTPPYYINMAYPFVTDGMLAVRENPNGQWGFLNTETGELLTVDFKGAKSKNKVLKALGINGKGVKGTFVLDFVAPFVEGLAVVYTEKTGWHHIDKNGQERLKNSNQKPTMFRTSIHNGETVIFDEDWGIALCKEAPDGNAGLFYQIDDGYELKNYSVGLHYPYVIQTNGSKLILNTEFQADKYENAQTGDSIIFIERPPVVEKIETPKDSFILDRDIEVALSKRSVSAGAKGTAAITVDISNIGEFESGDLSVSINVNGTKKSWTGVIAVGATQQITLYVPAKFSATSISRDVEWTVECGENKINGSDTISIKRYKPSRR